MSDQDSLGVGRDPLPTIGSKWVSKDPRDQGLVVTVLAVSDRFIQIKRFNKTMVRTDRFKKAYRPAVGLMEEREIEMSVELDLADLRRERSKGGRK